MNRLDEPIMPSDTGVASVTPPSKHPYIINGHHWEATGDVEIGPGPNCDVTEWTCKGCGRKASTRETDQCPDPTFWVQLDTPGDGLGVCDDCGAVFVFEYRLSFYRNGCPECGSDEWRRDDDAAAEPETVIHPDGS